MEKEAESLRDLNAVCLQTAVLCVECEMVSNSPHDHCFICGSHSLVNLSCVLGGALPGNRAMVVESEALQPSRCQVVLNFPVQDQKPCRKTPGHKRSMQHSA
jgi:hypothetical protein